MKELTFYNLEEMERYYHEKANTYCFLSEFGETISKINIMFNLKIDSSILCNDINCLNIEVKDINARNIDSLDIFANQIIANDIDASNISCNKLIIVNEGKIKVSESINVSCIKCGRIINWVGGNYGKTKTK